MKGKQFFIAAALVLAAFTAGIYVGAKVTQACAIQQAAIYEAQIKGMKTELLQMREEWLEKDEPKGGTK